MKGQKQLHRKSTDTPDGDLWYTPRSLINYIEDNVILDKFALDAAACELSTVAKRFYSKEDNALNIKWGKGDLDDPCYMFTGWTFCNPPYSLISQFVDKAIQESIDGIKIVLLVPARTDTKWFFKLYMEAKEIRLIKGRVKFWNPNKEQATSAPFPSAIIVLDHWSEYKEYPARIGIYDLDSNVRSDKEA